MAKPKKRWKRGITVQQKVRQKRKKYGSSCFSYLCHISNFKILHISLNSSWPYAKCDPWTHALRHVQAQTNMPGGIKKVGGIKKSEQLCLNMIQMLCCQSKFHFHATGLFLMALSTYQCFPLDVGRGWGGGWRGYPGDQTVTALELWQTTLAQGWDLRFFSEKISKKLCLNLKAGPGVLDTKLCHMGREGIRPQFFNIV